MGLRGRWGKLKIRTGIPASRGIAIGQVHFYDNPVRRAGAVRARDPKRELARFEDARQRAREMLSGLYRKALEIVGPEESIIFQIHEMLLEDEDYIKAVTTLITKRGHTAEYAVQKAGERLAQTFAVMEDAYLKERSADMIDISNRVVRLLCGDGCDGLPDGAGSLIVAARSLLPSETIQMDRGKVLGFITSEGSRNSHSAILTRAMGMPAVVSLGEQLADVRQGNVVIVDGFNGQVIISPNEATLMEYRQKRDEYTAYRQRLAAYKDARSRTKDGVPVFIGANIGHPSDVSAVLSNGGDGVGLFRTEALYMESREFPTEEAQLEVYRTVLSRMGDRHVVIRTLSIGSERTPAYFRLAYEQNSALGQRSIRISLKRPDIFKTQLRALLRASVAGKLSILFPMVSSMEQMQEVQSLLADCKAELDAEGIPYDHKLAVGVSIETPAAAMISDQLAREAGFFMIGSNNLTQYTLAVDRANGAVSELYDTRSRAVLRLIRFVAANASGVGIPCAIAGDAAADRELTKLLISMGVTGFAVPPSSILEVREKVCSLNLITEKNALLSRI